MRSRGAKPVRLCTVAEAEREWEAARSISPANPGFRSADAELGESSLEGGAQPRDSSGHGDSP